MQNCGLEAEIINYRSTIDVDIKFSNGTKIKHRRYNDFTRGLIRHPHAKRFKKYMHQRIGDKQTQNCGLEAEIIDYQLAKNITIMFSDNIMLLILIKTTNNNQIFIKINSTEMMFYIQATATLTGCNITPSIPFA